MNKFFSKKNLEPSWLLSINEYGIFQPEEAPLTTEKSETSQDPMYLQEYQTARNEFPIKYKPSKYGEKSETPKRRSVFFSKEKSVSIYSQSTKATLKSNINSVASLKDLPEQHTGLSNLKKKLPSISLSSTNLLSPERPYLPFQNKRDEENIFQNQLAISNFGGKQDSERKQNGQLLISTPKSHRQLVASKPNIKDKKQVKFDAQVKHLENMIRQTEINVAPIKRNTTFQQNQNILKCFQTLINFDVLNEDYCKFQMHQKSSPIILQEARNIFKQQKEFVENQAGLIFIQTHLGCYIIPEINGEIMENKVYMHQVGMKFLIKEIKNSLQYELNGFELKEAEMDLICKEIILKCCYFASNYSNEKIHFLHSYQNWVMFKKPLDQLKDSSRNFYDHILNFQLGYHQIECTEHLFNPREKHRYMPSLTDLLKESIAQKSEEEKFQILSNVVCSGSIFQLKGFKNRLQMQLEKDFKDLGVISNIVIIPPINFTN